MFEFYYVFKNISKIKKTIGDINAEFFFKRADKVSGNEGHFMKK
jgi:hypothetical protein